MRTTDPGLAQRQAEADPEGRRAGRVAARHENGKLTARERLDVLLDEGSFIDVSQTAPVEVLAGSGTIAGRALVVFAQDATVSGGFLSEIHAQKITTVQDVALRDGVPIIGLFDAEGVRREEGLAALKGYGDILRRAAHASGIVPQISVVMGPCIGGDAHVAACADFTFMVRHTGHLFVAGPDVVKAVTNETVSADELGGAGVHAALSAVADGAFENDVEALLQVRRLLEFLPGSNNAKPPGWQASSADEDDPSLDTLVPTDPASTYDVGELVEKVADLGDIFEIQEDHAKNIVTAFGRVEGQVVGFVANQPEELAGVLDGDACRKAARFVRFCNGFSIPLVTFVDTPGFLPGLAAEQDGLVKYAAKLSCAYAEATVPKVTVIVRRAFGSAYTIMASKQLGADRVFAWPTAQIGLTFADTATSFPGWVDEVISPASTRRRVARALEELRNKAVDGPWKKHGTIAL